MNSGPHIWAASIAKLSPQPVGCVVFVVWVLSFETGSSYIPETGSPSASESCVLGSQEHTTQDLKQALMLPP